jgi:hypothetical protein
MQGFGSLCGHLMTGMCSCQHCRATASIVVLLPALPLLGALALIAATRLHPFTGSTVVTAVVVQHSQLQLQFALSAAGLFCLMWSPTGWTGGLAQAGSVAQSDAALYGTLSIWWAVAAFLLVDCYTCGPKAALIALVSPCEHRHCQLKQQPMQAPVAN